MQIFSLTKQFFFTAGFQGINVAYFYYNGYQGETEIIEQFLHSSAYKDDSLAPPYKELLDNNFLGRPLNMDAITLADFKYYGKKEIIDFFDELIDAENPGADIKQFLTLKDKFYELIADCKHEPIYMISKDWFDLNSPKINALDSMPYSYYFILIVLKSNTELRFFEWSYD